MQPSLFKQWRPSREFFLAPLEIPKPCVIRLDRFPRGVDNIHVDVALGRELINTARAYVEFILREEVEKNFWRDASSHLDSSAPELFRKQYVAVTKRVVHESRAQVRIEWVQLFQLAVLKLSLLLVDVELSRLRQAVETERSNDGVRDSARSVTLHERLVTLGRYEDIIRQRCSQKVVKGLNRMEQAGLRKLRATVLGNPWPLPDYLLFNPLLQLGGMGIADEFVGQYPLLLRDAERFDRLNSVVCRLFAEWLPDWVQPPTDLALPETMSHPKSPGLRGLMEVEHYMARFMRPEEYRKSQNSWLDQPENIGALFDLGRNKTNLSAWRHHKWPAFQKRLMKQFIQAAGRDELLSEAEASYRLAGCYTDLGMPGQVDLVHDYLRGRLNKRMLGRRLESNLSKQQCEHQIKRLEAIRNGLHQDKRMGAEEVAGRLLLDYARFRRDLKAAAVAYRAMNQIRLLLDPQEVELSRSNGLLQVFDVNEAGAVEREVTGHVILKADIRGSTGLTKQMRARNLNPAAHFSRNLYDPINALLQYFDASKVFVEGDAVILVLLEKSGAHLAVARACGLANKILGVLESKNAESRRLGLPELEVGIGIAYCEESPTFLYDEGHRITISPAINLADRLSSCNRRLRGLLQQREDQRYGVEVALPLNGEDHPIGEEEDLLRCNVNGVELDTSAFYHLRAELELQTLEFKGAKGEPAMLYHVGNYPDTRGNVRWLVIKESPIRLWIGNELVPGERDGRHFYQVVTDNALIDKICSSPEVNTGKAKFLV